MTPQSLNIETEILSLCPLEQTTLTYLRNRYQAAAAMVFDAQKQSIVSVGQVKALSLLHIVLSFV